MTIQDVDPIGTIAVVTTAEERVLRLAGEIDTAVVNAFRGRDDAQPQPVDTIDVSDVTFLASPGVSLLVTWAQVSTHANGRRPTLQHPRRAVRRVLEITGTCDLFEVVSLAPTREPSLAVQPPASMP